MSYYFAIVGTQDNPLFEYEFGTSKQGGDGQSRFAEQVRHLNQFILHSSLDIAEEVQWSHGQMSVFNSKRISFPPISSDRPIKQFWLTGWVCIQVPQVYRQVLQQLHLLLRHRRQRQVPPPPSAHRPDIGELVTIVNGHRRKPYESGDRGGHQVVLYRGLRELGQGHYESFLQGEYGGAESGVSVEGCGSWKKVFVI